MGEPPNRVVQVERFGDPDVLKVVDAPLPTAGRGEVRVRVLASSVQYTDVLIRRHLYPQTAARRPPFVLGYDVVGEIDQLGDGVRGFQVGDRVADLTVVGSNAAYRTLWADYLSRVPAGLDAAEAATLILSWTTAYQLLHRAARVQRGQRVSPLVRGAQARRPALRLRLLGGRAGAPSLAHHVDVDCALVSMEVVAWRQACTFLLDQRDAGATSRLVPGGPGAALRPVGNSRHPAARRRADLLR